MKIKHLLAACLISFPLLGAAQAKKPTIMVMPADVWCSQNGFMTEFDNQGETLLIPNYERALQTSPDLNNVIVKIGELMAEQGFPLKDMGSNLRSIRQNSAENAMTVSRASGAAIAETPLDRLLNRAKADIIVKVSWQVNSTGPKRSVTYSIAGYDAYTDKQIAAASGTGAPSFANEPALLLEEAVLEKMDGFTAQLQRHFDDLVENGREVSVEVLLFDNGSGMSLEDEFDGSELTEIIDDWMAGATVQHRYSLTDATDTQMLFEQVRIPLYRSNDMPMDTRHFVSELRKFLRKPPYNLDSKVLTKGLGKAVLVIGEK